MRTVGHSQYCLNIESFDDGCLAATFTTLVKDAQELKAKFRRTAGSYSAELKAQFDELFVLKNLQRYSPQLGREPSSVVRPGEHEVAALTGQRK